MKLIEKSFFLLLIFSIPIQLGKHFWPASAFVSGIRVDYLSPTLYFSDIILLIIFALSFNRLKKTLFEFVSRPLFIYSFTVLIIGGLISANPDASILKIIRLLEFLFFGLYVYVTFHHDLKDKFIYVLTLGGLIQCIILLLQFISQHSLDGVFYYFGERTIGSSSIGAAVFSFSDSLILRPYGTFPHPNVLAFYLLFPFTYLIFSLNNSQSKFFKSIALLFIFLGIILTFSRIVIVIALIIASLWFYQNLIKAKIYLIILYLVSVLFLGVVLFNRFTGSFINDLGSRMMLLKIAVTETIKHPFFGVGLNNFFYHEILYQKNITPTLLQPVHNIYMLWLVETGVFGSLIAFKLLRSSYNNAVHKLKSKDSFFTATSLLFFSILFIGLFDHYLLTLQQGQLLFALLLGLLFVRERE